MNQKDLKKDQGKAPYHLLPLDVLEPLVRVYEFGTKKYAPNSWRQFEPTQENKNRMFSALMRHLAEWQSKTIKGECAIDEESGLPTIAHVVWNAVTLMHLEQQSVFTEDEECLNGEVSIDEQNGTIFFQGKSYKLVDSNKINSFESCKTCDLRYTNACSVSNLCISSLHPENELKHFKLVEE